MDYKRDLYKQRLKKGQSDREVRDRLKKEESRNKKEALLLSKRRIPLSEIQEDKAPKKLAVQNRLERLKEWKKQRDEAKKKEIESKRRPLIGVAAANKKPQPSFTFGVSKSNSGDKLVHRSSSKELLTTSQPGEKVVPKPNKYAPPSKPAAPRATFTQRQATIVSSTSSNAIQKQQAVKPPAAKSVPKPQPIQKRTPPMTRSSTRIVTRQTSKQASGNSTTSSRPTRTTTSTRIVTRSTIPKQSAQPKTRASNKASSNNKPASSTASNKNSSGKKSSGNKSSSAKTRSSARKRREEIPISYSSSSEDMEVQTEQAASQKETVSAGQKHIQPSPCYVSVRANSQVQEIAFPLQFVDDAAWIPGAKRTPKSTIPDFDAAFGTSPFHTFSPFRFMGANKSRTPKQSFLFTFRKHMSGTPESLRGALRPSDMSNDSLMVEDTSRDVLSISHTRQDLSGLSFGTGRKRKRSLVGETSPQASRLSPKNTPNQRSGVTSKGLSASKSPSPVGESCSPSGMVVDSSALMVSFVNPGQSQDDAETETDPEADTIDLAYFYGLHSQATEKLTSIAEHWEEKLTSLENSEEEVLEDVLGQVRTTFGQARLLMNKKLKQYLGLVKVAEDQSGEHKTSAEDLQGFWDMVYYQVEDIYRKSDNLTEMERNGWKESAKKPTTTKGKKRAVTASKPPVERTSERAQAVREKREAVRNKLKELKAAAKRARETEVEMEVPSPKRTKEEADTIDLAYFYGLHSQATEKLTSIAEHWEEKLTSLENSEEEVSEDVLGQVRTTFGQARLLMNKKLKQYLGLVKVAEDQSGERKTTAEDLQGFWDMVYYQVEDIYRKSDNLTEMERNGWKESAKKPTTMKGKKRAVTASKPPVEKTSERAQAAREKREAARNKFKELKAAAKRARETENTEVEMEVPSPKRTKEDTKPPTPKSSRRRSIRKTPSEFRRTSIALINFDDDSDPPRDNAAPPSDHAHNPSDFSPPVGASGSQSDDADVPTGQLLSLSPGKVDQKSPFKFRMTTPLKSPFKVPTNTPSSTSHSDSGGASLRRYISITPSKRVRDLIGADMIMSPVRRSRRLADNGTTTSSSTKRMVLTSLMDVPNDIDFAYCPNHALQ